MPSVLSILGDSGVIIVRIQLLFSTPAMQGPNAGCVRKGYISQLNNYRDHDYVTCVILTELMKLAQPVYVYREDKDSRLKTIAELKRRAQSGGIWPQFLIFPEGTTTNRKALISFKAGGFIPAMPVQPVVLRYPDEWVSSLCLFGG